MKFKTALQISRRFSIKSSSVDSVSSGYGYKRVTFSQRDVVDKWLFMLNELIKKVMSLKMVSQIPEIKRNTARNKLKVTTLHSPSPINPNNYWLFFFAVHSMNSTSYWTLYCCTLNAVQFVGWMIWKHLYTHYLWDFLAKFILRLKK